MMLERNKNRVIKLKDKKFFILKVLGIKDRYAFHFDE